MNKYNINLEKALIVLPLVASKRINNFIGTNLEVGVNEHKEAYVKSNHIENRFLLTIMEDGKVWYSGEDKDIDKDKIAHDIDYYICVLIGDK